MIPSRRLSQTKLLVPRGLFTREVRTLGPIPPTHRTIEFSKSRSANALHPSRAQLPREAVASERRWAPVTGRASAGTCCSQVRAASRSTLVAASAPTDSTNAGLLKPLGLVLAGHYRRGRGRLRPSPISGIRLRGRTFAGEGQSLSTHARLSSFNALPSRSTATAGGAARASTSRIAGF